jgi:hypothetical protein
VASSWSICSSNVKPGIVEQGLALDVSQGVGTKRLPQRTVVKGPEGDLTDYIMTLPPETTPAEVLRHFGPDYLRTHGLSTAQARA